MLSNSYKGNVVISGFSPGCCTIGTEHSDAGLSRQIRDSWHLCEGRTPDLHTCSGPVWGPYNKQVTRIPSEDEISNHTMHIYPNIDLFKYCTSWNVAVS